MGPWVLGPQDAGCHSQNTPLTDPYSIQRGDAKPIVDFDPRIKLRKGILLIAI